jgi:hypothetical protein
MRLQADACDLEAEIAGMETAPGRAAHYMDLANQYRMLAAKYEFWAGEDEKRNARMEGVK